MPLSQVGWVGVTQRFINISYVTRSSQPNVGRISVIRRMENDATLAQPPISEMDSRALSESEFSKF